VEAVETGSIREINMAKWIWWIIRSIVYSVVIFAFMYYFIYLGAIPNLWVKYRDIFTINTMIIVSIICGFIFSSIITFLKLKTKNKK
jgi:hypothetical protein